MPSWLDDLKQSCTASADESLLDTLTHCTSAIDGLMWNNVLTLAVLLLVGLYLTLRMRLVQIRGFRHAAGLITGRYTHPEEVGEVSHFQALSTALSATVGTGNIAGVATAITLGGPGALFWMWVTAAIGMATKFTECTLSLKFREVGEDGVVAGGPMYTLLNALKMRRTAILFAVFAMIASFGIGNMVQANSIVDGLTFIFPEVREDASLKTTVSLVIGFTLAILVALVIIGGVKRIAHVASALVPFMAVLYLAAAIIVLITHITAIPAALGTIFNSALNIWAVGGAAVGEAIRWGVARGLFSNEAGLGSSPIAHAAARTNEPVREGLVAMMEPFIDTLVICTMTGLVIVVTGMHLQSSEDLTGAALTAAAFGTSLGHGGSAVVGFGLMLFAFTTIIAWSYYGDRCVHFLFGDTAVMAYRVIYVFAIVLGAYFPLTLVWNIADITVLLMAIPNLLSLILLAGLVKKLSDDYFSRSYVPLR